MSMNLRADGTFVEDKGWHQAAQRYDEYIQRHKNLKIVFMELGVGYNTPGIIKYPFWQMTNAYPQASYICLNQSEASAPAEIAVYYDILASALYWHKRETYEKALMQWNSR